ncbi:hypothetical protein J2W42_003120 [Rhizobium tibeticum]|nr:hypothetical protein [Rhizobium tibeticum]
MTVAQPLVHDLTRIDVRIYNETVPALAAAPPRSPEAQIWICRAAGVRGNEVPANVDVHPLSRRGSQSRFGVSEKNSDIRNTPGNRRFRGY